MQCVTSLTVLSVLACIVLKGTAQRQEPDFKQPPPPPLIFTHRFRREESRGSIDVNARREDRNNGQSGSNLRVDANYNIWKSRDGKARIDANAYHERNWGAIPGPRRNTGGMITFTGRFPG